MDVEGMVAFLKTEATRFEWDNHLLWIALHCVIFMVVGHGIWKPMAQSYFSKRKWWPNLVGRSGAICTKSAQEDIVLCSVIFVSHSVGGLLVAYSIYTNQPWIFLQGVYVELGYEIVDTLCILLATWPYKPGKEFIESRVAMLIHHLFGIMTGIPIAYWSLHTHEDVQLVALVLLSASVVSVVSQIFEHTLHAQENALLRLVTYMLTFGSFIYARFVVFPFPAYRFVLHMRETKGEAAFYGLAVGVGFIVLFNTLLLTPVVSKVVRLSKAVHEAHFAKPEADAKKVQ